MICEISTFSVHYLSQTYIIHLGKLSRPPDLIQEVATVLAKYSATLPFAQIYHIFTCTDTTFVIELDIEFKLAYQSFGFSFMHHEIFVGSKHFLHQKMD